MKATFYYSTAQPSVGNFNTELNGTLQMQSYSTICGWGYISYVLC